MPGECCFPFSLFRENFGPLRRVDENGVILSYGYNSARQLVEIIRSATARTPESITTYSGSFAITSNTCRQLSWDASMPPNASPRSRAAAAMSSR